MTILARNLKRLVREHDIPSYKALAKKTGVSNKILKKTLEDPEYCASTKTRIKIAEAFGEDPLKMSKEEPVDILDSKKIGIHDRYGNLHEVSLREYLTKKHLNKIP